MSVIIKRENWNGKFRIVARKKGRLVTHSKWGRKFTVEKATRIFKRNKTFSETRKIKELTKVSEVTEIDGDIPAKRLTTRYQYFIESRLGEQIITARSLQKELNVPKSIAREEALENFYARVDGFANELGETGDIEKGKEFFDMTNELQRNLKEGVVYYKGRA